MSHMSDIDQKNSGIDYMEENEPDSKLSAVSSDEQYALLSTTSIKTEAPFKQNPDDQNVYPVERRLVLPDSTVQGDSHGTPSAQNHLSTYSGDRETYRRNQGETYPGSQGEAYSGEWKHKNKDTTQNLTNAVTEDPLALSSRDMLDSDHRAIPIENGAAVTSGGIPEDEELSRVSTGFIGVSHVQAVSAPTPLNSMESVVANIETLHQRNPGHDPHKKKPNIISTIYGGLKSILGDTKDDEPFIETVFHVHIPSSELSYSSYNSQKVVVVGNVAELGNWNATAGIQLRLISTKSGHWASESVRIKLVGNSARTDESFIIQYKYGIRRYEKVELEGDGGQDNREMTFSGYQFDIWKPRYYSSSFHYNQIPRCMFVCDIAMDPFTSLDGKLKALSLLSDTNQGVTKQGVSTIELSVQLASAICDFATKNQPRKWDNRGDNNQTRGANLSSASSDAISPIIFLCITLGKCLQLKSSQFSNNNRDFNYDIGADTRSGFSTSNSPLPIEFPSSLLLSILGGQIDMLHYTDLQGKLPKDLWKIYADGIGILAAHNNINVKRSVDGLEWMFLFRLTTIPSDYNDRATGDDDDIRTIQEELLLRLLDTMEEPYELTWYTDSVFIDRLNDCILPTLYALEIHQAKFQREFLRLLKIIISFASSVETLLHLYKNFPSIHAAVNSSHKNQEPLQECFRKRMRAIIDCQDLTSLKSILEILPDNLRSLEPFLLRNRVLNILEDRNTKWSTLHVETIIQLMTDVRVLPTNSEFSDAEEGRENILDFHTAMRPKLDLPASDSNCIGNNSDMWIHTAMRPKLDLPASDSNCIGNNSDMWTYINRALKYIYQAKDPNLLLAFPELLRHFLEVGMRSRHGSLSIYESRIPSSKFNTMTMTADFLEQALMLCIPWFQNLLRRDMTSEMLDLEKTLFSGKRSENIYVDGNQNRNVSNLQSSTMNQAYNTFRWLAHLLKALQPLTGAHHSPAVKLQNDLLHHAQLHVKALPEDILYIATTDIGLLEPECIPKTFQMLILSRISGVSKKHIFDDAYSGDEPSESHIGNISLADSQVYAHREWSDQFLKSFLQVCSSSGQKLTIQHRLSEQVVCYLLDQSAPITQLDLALSDSVEYKRTLETLLRNAKYWLILLNAAGSVSRILDHPRLRIIREYIFTLQSILIDGSITMQLLRGTVLKTPDTILLQLFERCTSTYTNNSNQARHIVTSQMLEEAHSKPDQHLNNLELLRRVIHRFCIDVLPLQDRVKRFKISWSPLTKSSENMVSPTSLDGDDVTIQSLHESEKWIVVDADELLLRLQDMKERFSRLTLTDIRLQNQWNDFLHLLQVAKNIENYAESTTFMNVFLKTISDSLSNQNMDAITNTDKGKGKAVSSQNPGNLADLEQDEEIANSNERDNGEDVQVGTMLKLTVHEIIEFISIALEKYLKSARWYVVSLNEWKLLTTADVLSMWCDVPEDRIEKELEVLYSAVASTSITTSKSLRENILNMLHNVVGIRSQISKLSNIRRAIMMLECEFSHSNNIFGSLNWLTITIDILSKDEQKVDNLESVFRSLKKRRQYDELSNNGWELIKELTLSEELIRFLKTVFSMDFRSLINAVEDHSDQQLLREDTVSSLIEVRRFLSPLMEYFTRDKAIAENIANNNRDTTIDRFLDKIHHATQESPQLATRLRLCNANKTALQNMYANITNRGEVTKERIINAVDIGIFTFERTEDGSACVTSMYYKNKQGAIVTYNLNDLHDLRGRALMIAGSTDKIALIAEMDEQSPKAGTVIGAPNNLRTKMMNFVQQVATANEISIIASKLITLGHFEYARQFKYTVASITEMVSLLEDLSKEYRSWQEIVSTAQAQSFYLTFFRGRQVLQLHDLFFGEHPSSESALRECATLLKLVSSHEKYIKNLSALRNTKDFAVRQNRANPKEDGHLHALLAVGEFLDAIFVDLPQDHITKDLDGILDHKNINLSGCVFPGQLFVAACNDKARVPNIIMELYATTVSQKPEPWQLYVCRSSTTLEEIDLFLLRCFNAYAHGYENSLFCMANLEELDFDLQHKLVQHVHTLISNASMKSRHLLALVCYREQGGVHILDQFAQYVRNLNGLSAKMMKKVMAKLCPTVVRVTSNITGEGKTEWIKNSSYQNGMMPRNLHLSGNVQRTGLVRRFQSLGSLKSFECLHLDIGHVQNASELNMLLFEFLVLGLLNSEDSIALLPTKHIFVEIASTPGNELAHSMRICDALVLTHLHWDINNIIVSNEAKSPIQIVCRFLDLLDSELLDSTDVRFPAGNTKVTRCRELLDKYFFEGRAEISSFRFLDIFLRVLAEQLVRLSKSTFFQVANLQLMAGENNNIRSTLVMALINVSKDFATRSIASSSMQNSQLTAFSSDMTSTSNLSRNSSGTIVPQQTESESAISVLGNGLRLTEWTDSNHLLVFFQSQNPEAISALYRDRALVPKNIENLLRSQVRGGKNGAFWSLEDYDQLQPEQLLTKLESLARSSLHRLEYPEYALSADNLLKMATMLLRVRADIPVVLCGEAGCGKTSLIRFLSLVVEVPHFMVMNLHAGITEDQIIKFMHEAEERARASSANIWVFFDEINTCNHLSLVTDIICHRMFLGRLVNRRIQFFAACNPYRLRDQAKTGVAGLEIQNKRYEEHSPLVYQVMPLPQILLDFVWSFGTLKPKDEQAYIRIMTKGQEFPLYFADLLFESQEFMREIDGPFSVSLRDVKRTLKLFEFFLQSIKTRAKLPRSRYPPSENNLPWSFRAAILALGLSYQSRLYNQSQRQQYRQRICSLPHVKRLRINDLQFQQILRDEEEDYLNRMIIPPSTALNEALLENTLAMTVCILTGIPLFLVGTPGSSKSLAIRLVHQNLKGSDSDDPYFRTLPQIYIIPHQGSSSSTSEGITKVFETANKYQEMNSKTFPLRTVVLLDEIGLAEGSPFNPLKVLHYLLEPSYPSKGPSVSVIGISNWRLDHSKTSRALLVQRPELGLEDLVETARRLVSSNAKTLSSIQNRKLRQIAQAYTDYEKTQKYTNFHGLRDYYAFVKNFGKHGNNLSPSGLHFALARNFGGLDDKGLLWRHFSPIVYDLPGNEIGYQDIPIRDVIESNLNDTIEDRHLMAIGNSGAIIGILEHIMKSQGLNPVIIYGSQLPDDQMTNDYSYSVLNKILMCVESGRALILCNLDILYGSLYDLWNQNYMTVGSKDDPKYYCRVALGDYANPMCYVHPRFRSILVMDNNEIQSADAPLLNRFEKQRVSFNDILDQNMKSVVADLEEWATRISTPAIDSKTFANDASGEKLETIAGSFTVEDMFVGFEKHTTSASLVSFHSSTKHEFFNLLDACKADLIDIACSDAIVRSGESMLAMIDPQEVARWKDVYFNCQHHNDLRSFFSALLSENPISAVIGRQLMIKTFSNINVDISACLDGLMRCQVDKLSTFKSEAQLTNRLKTFWNDSSSDMLVLQCDVQTTNEGSVKLAKHILELQQREYLAKVDTSSDNGGERKAAKHIMMIFHLYRNIKGISCRPARFDFLSGWSQVVIETLEEQPRPLSQLLQGSIRELIQTAYPFDEIFRQEVSWCLVSMKYPTSLEALEHIKMLLQAIPSCTRLIDNIHRRLEEWLDQHKLENWQSTIARTKQMLLLSASFPAALDRHVRSTVRIPTAKIICQLERLSALTTYLTLSDILNNDEVATQSVDHTMKVRNIELLQFWEQIFENKDIVNIEHLVDPGPDAYLMSSASLVNLQFPFSKYFADRIDSYRQLFQENSEALKEDQTNVNPETREVYPHAEEAYILHFIGSVEADVQQLRSIIFRRYSELYFEDYIRIILNRHGYVGDHYERILKFILEGRMQQYVSNPIRLHIEWWKHSEVILAELELIFSCGTDIIQSNELFNPTLSVNNDTFEEFLMRVYSDEMLLALLTVANDDLNIDRWSKHTTTLLSFCAMIGSLSPPPRLQLLRVLNDLVLALAISSVLPLSELREAIVETLDFDEANFFTIQNVFTDTFVSKMLSFIVSFTSEHAECANTLWRTFISRCLSILPAGSSTRVQLYQSVFSESNAKMPFVGPILLRIFHAEDQLQPDIVYSLAVSRMECAAFESVRPSTIDETVELNPRLHVINMGLTVAGLNSCIAALSCDIVQKEFFASLEFNQLYELFGDIKANLLEIGQATVLQSIIVIAYMKEFISQFRERYIEEFGLLECKMDFDHAPEFLDEFRDMVSAINQNFESNPQLPVMDSLRIYFLKGLRASMSINDVRRFCNLHSPQLPWLANLAWNFTADEARLPFNPFQYLPLYEEVDRALANLASRNNAEPLQALLTKAVDDFNIRFTLLGSFAIGFQFRQATRELNDTEARVATWVQDHLRSDSCKLNDIYRTVGIGLLSNDHPLLHVSTKDSVSTLLMKSVVIHVITLHTSMAADASPLAMYLHDIPNLDQTYVLTCPSDIESVVLNALISPSLPQLSRWTCKCGYRYVVGECGKTMQESVCPQCKNKIGGQSHVANIGNNRLDVNPVYTLSVSDQTGYIEEATSNVNTCAHVGHSVRSLSPAAYRILHLFVHAVLPPSIATVNGWQQYCLTHIENDWNQLKVILNCNDETLALGLHDVVANLQSMQLPISHSIGSFSQEPLANRDNRLITSELREQWEKAFSDQCVLPVIRNIQQTSVAFARKIRSVTNHSLLEIEVDELTALMSPEYHSTHFPRLWRRIDDTSFDSFRAYYWSDPIRQKKHPFLSLFFQYHERLGRLQHLAPIVKFVGIVFSRLAYRLKRLEARNMTFRNFLEKQHDGQALESSFDRFAHAWNSIRTHFNRYQCHEFESVPMIHRDLSIVLAIPREEDDSIYLLAALEHLVDIQNGFLNETINITEGVSALRSMDTSDHLSGRSKHETNTLMSDGQFRYLRSVRLMEAHDSQIINYEWAPEILEYSQRNPELGMGSEFTYDLHKIELELAYKLIFDKAHLGLEWDPFPFHLELFHNGSDILNDVAAIVPQEPVPADAAAAMRTDAVLKERASEILSDVELLLSFIKRTGISATSSDTVTSSSSSGSVWAISITDYCKQWVKLSVLLGKSFQQTALATLQLRHVVGLYEIIEEMVSDVVMEFLEQKFKQALPPAVEKDLQNALDWRSTEPFATLPSNSPALSAPERYQSDIQSKILPTEFATALKRFMTRYLSVGQGDIRAETQLIYYLGDPARFWAVSNLSSEARDNLAQNLERHFPETLLVSHTHAAYSLIVKQLERLAASRASRSSTRPAAASPSTGFPSVLRRSILRGKKNNYDNM